MSLVTILIINIVDTNSDKWVVYIIDMQFYPVLHYVGYVVVIADVTADSKPQFQ